MIIQVTGTKYRVGCNRGYGINIPNLEFKLNLIIDKKRSTWPDSRTKEEIDAGVPGPVKEIKEGDTFLFEGTILAVDHDRLVQVISETGPLAFQRIYDSYIKPEIEFSEFEDDDNNYSWDDDLKELPQNLEEYTPSYNWMKIWHDNFCKDRNLRKDYIIRVKITDILLGLSRFVYMREWKIYYSKEDFDNTEIEYYLKKIMSYFYSEVERV